MRSPLLQSPAAHHVLKITIILTRIKVWGLREHQSKHVASSWPGMLLDRPWIFLDLVQISSATLSDHAYCVYQIYTYTHLFLTRHKYITQHTHCEGLVETCVAWSAEPIGWGTPLLIMAWRALDCAANTASSYTANKGKGIFKRWQEQLYERWAHTQPLQTLHDVIG